MSTCLAALVEGVAAAGHGLSDMISDDQDMRSVVIRQLSKALEPTLRNVQVCWRALADCSSLLALAPILVRHAGGVSRAEACVPNACGAAAAAQWRAPHAVRAGPGAA